MQAVQNAKTLKYLEMTSSAIFCAFVDENQ